MTDDEQMPDKVAKGRSPSAAEWPALGFVPPDSNLVAVLRWATLGKARQNQGLPLPGPVPEAVRNWERWTGLEADLIDHVALATTLAGDWPQLTVVVRTTKPYSAQAIARARQPQQPTLWHHRPVYRLKLSPLGEGLLWLVDQQTLIMVARPDAVKIEDAAAVPVKPHAGLAMLSTPLRELVRQRLSPQAVFLLAGHLEKSDPLRALLAFTPLSQDQVNLLASIQTFGLGLELHQGLTLTSACRCRDAQAANLLRQTLARWPVPENAVRVVDPPSAEATEDGWVSLRIRMDGADWPKLWEALPFILPALASEGR